VELGCGGALIAERLALRLIIIAASAGSRRGTEAAEAAAILGASLTLLGRPDGNVIPDASLVADVEAALVGVSRVYVHHPDDTHQDHRATTAAVLSAVRRSSADVLFYEGPSTGPSFVPSTLVRLDAADLLARRSLLVAHASQAGKACVDADRWEALASVRAYPAGWKHAEAFQPYRLTLVPRSPDADLASCSR
jgi:LmbE family N-acetylglucosaminyl deacetylase